MYTCYMSSQLVPSQALYHLVLISTRAGTISDWAQWQLCWLHSPPHKSGFSYLVGGKAHRVLNKGDHNAKNYKQLWLKMQEKGRDTLKALLIHFWALLRKRITEINNLYFLSACAEAQGQRSSLWPEKLLCQLLFNELWRRFPGTRMSRIYNCTCTKGVLTILPVLVPMNWDFLRPTWWVWQ